MNITRWRLPGFVDYAACREDQNEAYLASKGVSVLRSSCAPAVGQQAAIEVHLFGDLGWGMIKGLLSDVRRDGSLALNATLTTEGPELLDAMWDLVLRFDPEAFDGAWVVETMTADGVVTVPRQWPRMLVERLRDDGSLLAADADVPEILRLVRERALQHAAMTTVRECAAFTARALLRAFERADAVEEIFVDPEQLASVLETIRSPPEADGL